MADNGNEPMAEEYDVLKARFTYIVADKEKIERIDRIQETAFNLAILISALVPDGLEKDFAFARLEEVVSWARDGIKRHGYRNGN